MASELVPFKDMQQMAETFAKSKMFGIANPEQALALMLLCQAENLHPAQAIRDYHIIAGKPALKADAMMSKFQNAGGKVEWLSYTDQEVKATFTHPQGGTLTLSWTIEQAKRAGLATKDVWRQYPRAMLRSRVISEGIRTIFPGVLGGMYAPEEVQDFDCKPPAYAPAEKVIEGEVVMDTPQADLETHLNQMSSCETMECLKQTFTVAKMAFRADKDALVKIAAKKDAVKARLDAKIAEEAEEV